MRNKTIEIIFLILLLAVVFFLYNILNLSSDRWTFSPDSQDTFVFSRVLLESGHSWYQSELNNQYNTTCFWPSLTDYESSPSPNGQITGSRFVGLYFVVALGHLLGNLGPFFIVSLTGVISVVFFYLIVRELYGFKTAALSSLFFGLSPSMIYFGNMLFSNIVALSLFMGGFYFLVKAVRNVNTRIYYLFAAIFLIFSIWVRYDYIFPVGLSLIYFLWHWRRLNRKYIFQSALCLLGIGTIVCLTQYLATGSIIGYFWGWGESTFGQAVSETFIKYPTRMFDPAVIYNNTTQYIFHITPFLTIFGILGMVQYLRDRKGDLFLLTWLIITAFITYYYGKNPDYWGYDRNWNFTSYTRYFLPVFTGLALFSGVFFYRLYQYLQISGKVVRNIMIILVILVFMVSSLNYTINAHPYGINYTKAMFQGETKAIENFASSLPPKSILVDCTDGYYKKMISSRQILWASKIP
jgi:4-amino-4-deoxy-L-arabinose transferase-like glycosyltransferase